MVNSCEAIFRDFRLKSGEQNQPNHVFISGKFIFDCCVHLALLSSVHLALRAGTNTCVREAQTLITAPCLNVSEDNYSTKIHRQHLIQ